VKRNFEKFEHENCLKIIDPDKDLRIKLANNLADIAERYGIKMLTCCGDYLLNNKISKAHCVDGQIVEELFYKNGFEFGEKPTRKECGCTDSADIGNYDTCPHGCIYCYANINKKVAENRQQNHDKNAAFLGYAKEESDKWAEAVKLAEMEKGMENGNESKNKKRGTKMTLFDYE
jgi:histone acetyltransferase (RNA polymerase elongator complex component)